MITVFRIEDATDTDSIAVVRDLLREYSQTLGIDLCFQDFDAELEGLPGDYVRPNGCILLARADGVVAGCGALRRLMDWQLLDSLAYAFNSNKRIGCFVGNRVIRFEFWHQSAVYRQSKEY